MYGSWNFLSPPQSADFDQEFTSVRKKILRICVRWLTRPHSAHHRLIGSSSPVLTATSLSYGKAKNSTPHRIKTPDPIEIKFGRVDYVGEGTRHAKFYASPSKGYTQKFFIAIYLFLVNSPTGQTLRRIFARDGSNDAVSRKDVPFWG